MLTKLHLRCRVPDLCRTTAHFGCNSPYNRVLQQQRCLPFEQGCAVWRSQGGVCCHMDALGLAPLQHGLVPEVWVALDLQPAMHTGATLCPCQISAPQGSELYSVKTCDYRYNMSLASTPVYYTMFAPYYEKKHMRRGSGRGRGTATSKMHITQPVFSILCNALHEHRLAKVLNIESAMQIASERNVNDAVSKCT